MLTSKLGSAESKLGNIELGINPPSIIDRSFSLGAIASISELGGLTYLQTLELLGTSSISVLPGFGYFKTLTIAATVSATGDRTYQLGGLLSIDCTAALDSVLTYEIGVSEIIAGVAQYLASPSLDYELSDIIESKAAAYVEGLHNNLNLLIHSNVDELSGSTQVSNEIPIGISSISFSATAILNRTINQVLNLTQSARNNPHIAHVTQTLTFSQQTRQGNILLRSITETLIINQTAFRVFTTQSTLSLIQSISVTRVHNQRVNQTLHISPTVIRTATLHRAGSNTLIFRSPNIVLPIGGLIFTPPPVQGTISPSRTGCSTPTNNGRCYIYLGVPEQTILLPCPQLGDSQSNSSTMTLKRTMTGGTLTYMKKTGLQKLKYSFWLGRQKSLELKDFLINYAERIITLYNFKGETWYAALTNSPFEFVAKERYQPQGERIEVTLEFEGVKVGG